MWYQFFLNMLISFNVFISCNTNYALQMLIKNRKQWHKWFFNMIHFFQVQENDVKNSWLNMFYSNWVSKEYGLDTLTFSLNAEYSSEKVNTRKSIWTIVILTQIILANSFQKLLCQICSLNSSMNQNAQASIYRQYISSSLLYLLYISSYPKIWLFTYLNMKYL